MSPVVAGREAGVPFPMRVPGWRGSIPALTLLAAQVGLYVWMAPRGFDFTDESYYFLNYLHWRELLGTATFFGAYFEWPFRLLGQSVPAIRVFSVVLLMASSAFFALEALGYFARREIPTTGARMAIGAVGMAASFFGFGQLATVRAPSYNLLALCSMLVATGAMLRVLQPAKSAAGRRLAMFVYGLAMGACGLGKASTAAMVVAVHGLFFVMANRDWRPRHLAELFVLCLAGASLNFMVLQLAHPHWLEALLEGVKLLSMDGSHSLVRSVNAARWELQAAAPAILASGLGAALVVAGTVAWLGSSRRTAMSVLVAIVVGGCVVGWMVGPVRWWLPWLSMGVLLPGIVEAMHCRSTHCESSGVADVSLMVLLLALPIAYAVGTNNPLLEHSQRAAVFPIVALLLRLHRLLELRLIAAPAYVACMTALCVPTLVAQVRAATDVRYTYRQVSALGAQSIPVSVGAGASRLLVDAVTHQTLGSLIDAARAAGLGPGQAILDFTGDGPGLIFVLEGRPVGLAWLPGGYPGSEAMAARVIERLPPRVLKGAWLLGSDNNPRAIKGWQRMLAARLGPGTHVPAATIDIRAPYRWGRDAPERVSATIYRPRTSDD